MRWEECWNSVMTGTVMWCVSKMPKDGSRQTHMMPWGMCWARSTLRAGLLPIDIMVRVCRSKSKMRREILQNMHTMNTTGSSGWWMLKTKRPLTRTIWKEIYNPWCCRMGIRWLIVIQKTIWWLKRRMLWEQSVHRHMMQTGMSWHRRTVKGGR